ncbi:MAG: hypothetical protein E7039_05990 [Lentisphaerae bacterium]|nr:hypothetical protein [Lentisphaerota bacterium]
MHKWMRVFLLFISCGMLSAADLVLGNGKKYSNAEIQRVLAGCVVVLHDEGKATLLLDDLPDNFIAALSTRQRMGLQDLADVKLADGRLLRKSNILELGNGKVVLSHLEGTTAVDAKELPAKYLATFTRNQRRKLAQTVRNAKQEKEHPDVQMPAVERRADGKVIHTGSRGGRYYINASGKRVYLPKKESDSE